MIRFVNLKKAFGDQPVLKGINFEVGAGEIVFVLGTSGTGKSVLLKNLVGLITPDSGEIWVDGINVVGYSEDQFFEIRRKVGMVFQQPALFDSLTAFENVAFGLRRLENLKGDTLNARVLESLDHVGLRNLSHRYPPTLSYGQQKRVSLARTVAVRPKVLLFDEPTTGLDPISTTAVNELIKNLSRQLSTTSIVVSHDMRCALAIADKIIVLDQGKVLAMGDPGQLKQSREALVQDFLREAQMGDH